VVVSTLSAEDSKDGQKHSLNRAVPTLDIVKCTDEDSLVAEIRRVLASQREAAGGKFTALYKGQPKDFPSKAPMFEGNQFQAFAGDWQRGNRLSHQQGKNSIGAALKEQFGKPATPGQRTRGEREFDPNALA
jgi:hypothetical protein